MSRETHWSCETAAGSLYNSPAFLRRARSGRKLCKNFFDGAVPQGALGVARWPVGSAQWNAAPLSGHCFISHSIMPQQTPGGGEEFLVLSVPDGSRLAPWGQRYHAAASFCSFRMITTGSGFWGGTGRPCSISSSTCSFMP